LEGEVFAENTLNHSASSDHGMMVDFTVFIAIASATARRYVIPEALLCGDRR